MSQEFTLSVVLALSAGGSTLIRLITARRLSDTLQAHEETIYRHVRTGRAEHRSARGIAAQLMSDAKAVSWDLAGVAVPQFVVGLDAKVYLRGVAA